MSVSRKLKVLHIADEACDTIRINDLILPVSLHSGAYWPLEAEEPIEQPISISLSIFHDVSETAQSDDLSHSIDYADIANQIRAAVILTPFICLQDLSRHICNTVASFSSLNDLLDGLEIFVRVKQLKAPLHSKTVSVQHFATFTDGSWTPGKITHFVEDLTCPAIIGVSMAERLEKQDVVVNLSIDTGDQGLDREDWIDLRVLTRMLYEEICTSNFVTLEALTSYIASETLSILKSYQPSPVVSVRIAKPAALPLAKSAEIEILRTFADYPEQIGEDEIHEYATSKDMEDMAVYAERSREGDLHTTAIALGSNLGDSFRNIEYALRLLEIPHEILGDKVISLDFDPTITVVNTSFLYESAPMYVTDQPSFINCACIVKTNLPSRTLLRVLKEIESIVGRLKTIRHGPRAVDLDIIFYDNDIVDTRSDTTSLDDVEGELIVPHPRMQEREFVLRPLNDMIPQYVHPALKKTVEALFREVCDPTGPPMNKVIPFPRFPLSSSFTSPHPSVSPVSETLTYWSHPSTPFPGLASSGSQQKGAVRPTKCKRHVMATLNVTPDSFSDGSKHDALPAALRYVCEAVAAGATIIDIGGYSTRPGAAFVGVEDEIARVVPVVQAMRDENVLRDVLNQCLNAGEDEREDASAPTPIPVSDEIIQRVLTTPISVDTFRPEVSAAAILAGANCINDVYAFTGPDAWPPPPPPSERGRTAADFMERMKAVAREYSVPVILMHSRGDAGKEKDYEQYAYVEDGQKTLEGVRVELGNKVEEIVLGKGGVRRWLVVADPGIGFSKTLEGNLEVLRNAREVVADVRIGGVGEDTYRNPLAGCPQLIGVSRKSFLGAILAQDPDGRETKPNERSWATAAAVACAVEQWAMVVRVHDVREMMDVVRVADALWS